MKKRIGAVSLSIQEKGPLTKGMRQRLAQVTVAHVKKKAWRGHSVQNISMCKPSDALALAPMI